MHAAATPRRGGYFRSSPCTIGDDQSTRSVEAGVAEVALMLWAGQDAPLLARLVPHLAPASLLGLAPHHLGCSAQGDLSVAKPITIPWYSAYGTSEDLHTPFQHPCCNPFVEGRHVCEMLLRSIQPHQ